MAKITYDDKSYLNLNGNIPNVNKVTDNDMNEIKSVVNTNYDEFLDNTFFKPGDTYEINYLPGQGGMYTGGTLTGSAKVLHWSITLPKSLKNITSITISNLNLTIRHVGGGYIYSEVSAVDGTLVVNKINDYIIDFANERVNAASATNNTPVAVAISCILTFS